MNRDEEILSGEFLKELTGYDLPSKQAQCLRRHNVFFIEGKNGEIKTTRAWLTEAARATKVEHDGDFNLDALSA